MGLARARHGFQCGYLASAFILKSALHPTHSPALHKQKTRPHRSSAHRCWECRLNWIPSVATVLFLFCFRSPCVLDGWESSNDIYRRCFPERFFPGPGPQCCRKILPAIVSATSIVHFHAERPDLAHNCLPAVGSALIHHSSLQCKHIHARNL